MSTDDVDIKTLGSTKWRTAISGRIEKFSALIENQEIFDQYFGDKYVEKLSNKADRLNRKIILFGIAYAILMVSLFVSQDAKKVEFEIFGYGFKNLGYYKEFLLLLAAGITPISSTLSAYHRYIVAIRDECIKKLAPNPIVREYYSQVHLDSYFDPIIKDNSGATSQPHGLAIFLAAAFGFVLLLLLLTLLAGTFLIQVNVIYDVATNPASSKFVNLFVIVFSLTAIGLSWLIGILQLPLPEIDHGNFLKLLAIRESDPERYKEILDKLAAESDRKETFWTAALSIIFFVVAYATISVVWYPANLHDSTTFVAKALPGAFLTTMVSRWVSVRVRKISFRWFFRTYTIESAHRLTIFSRIRKSLSAIRIITPIILSVSYTIYILHGL